MILPACLMMLSGCSTTAVPVDTSTPLPQPPTEGYESCPEGLVAAKDGTVEGILQASEGSKQRYRKCRLKVEDWKGWYDDQKAEERERARQ